MAQVLNKIIGGNENTKVEAFDEEWKSVGVFESMSQAARKLFIRYARSIWNYLNGNKNYKFTGKRKGIKSYKTGKRYHFKIVTNE